MRTALRYPLLLLGVVYLVFLVIFAICGSKIRTSQLRNGDPSFDAVYSAAAGPYLPPGAHNFPLGTDELGRDEIARLAQGAQVSLEVGVVVQIFAVSVGLIVATLGTFASKWIRLPLLRFTDAMFAFPDILLAILIVGALPTSEMGKIPVIGNFPSSELAKVAVIVALSITAWPSVTRLGVTQMATVKDREYVVAAKAAGASMPYLVWKHVLPQVMPLILAVSMIDMAGTALAESTLSFIGIGIQAPHPSWGNMINDVRSGDITSHVAQLAAPCILLSLTIFALNFVGDGLFAILDPKQTN